MKFKPLKLIILFSIVIAISIIIIVLIPKITIELIGDKEIILNFGDTYYEQGIKVVYNDLDISDKVVIKNNIDYNNLGTFYVEYKIDYKWYHKKVKRNVKIIDTKSPVITLNGDNPLYIVYGSEYKDPGYTIEDNYDKNLEAIVSNYENIDTKNPGNYTINYETKDTSGNKTNVVRDVIVEERIVVRNGVTYVEGILVVNKKYSIPSDYGNGVDSKAHSQLKLLQEAAKSEGLTIPLCSGYRSYQRQKTIYNNYVKVYGQTTADTFSARPGHSEHQTGLAFDVGKIDDRFGDTEAGIWLAKNAHLFGFVIRYPKGKQEITGYKYEPWHIRYLGVETATKVYESGLCLEEYLGI